MKTLVGGLVLSVVFGIADASAQIRRTHWGLSASFTPSWTTPDYQKVPFDADAVTLEGKTFRAGFVRGHPRRGDWGLSFVRRNLKDGASVRRGSTLTTLDPGATITGGEIGVYKPFFTARDRFQLGIGFGFGVGVLQGTGVRTRPGQPAEIVKAKSFVRISDHELPVVPTMRLELVGAVVATRCLKLKVSGGIDFPGQTSFSLGAVYFFGAR